MAFNPLKSRNYLRIVPKQIHQLLWCVCQHWAAHGWLLLHSGGWLKQEHTIVLLTVFVFVVHGSARSGSESKRLFSVAEIR